MVLNPTPLFPGGVWDSGWELGKKCVTHWTIWLVTSGASRIKAFGLREGLALGTRRPWYWVGAIACVRPGTGLARFPVGSLVSYRGWLSVRASYGYVFSEGPTPGQTWTALLSHGAEMMETEVGMGEVGMGEVGLGAGTAHRCVFYSLFPSVGLLPVGDKVKTVSQKVPRGQGLSAWEKSPGVSYGSSAPPPTPPWAPRTHRNLVCWRLWAPEICRYTSFSCRAREGCEAGALGEPLHPEDLLGVAGGMATGMSSGSTLLEAFTGGRSQGDPPAMHMSEEALLSHPDTSSCHGSFPLPSRHQSHTRPRSTRCRGPAPYILFHLLAQLVILSCARLQQVLGAEAGEPQGQSVGH